MAEALHFTLVSPERELFSGQVEQVIAPGELGDFGVLAGHAPFMTTLRLGALTVLTGDTTRRIFIAGGFADVTPDGLTVLAEYAAPVEDLDPQALAQSLQDAQEDLADAAGEDAAGAVQARIDQLTAMIDAVENAPYGQ